MTREQIETLLAGLDGVTSGPWMVKTKEHPFSFVAHDGECKTGIHKETWLLTEWIHAQLKDHMPVVVHAVGLGLDGGPAIQFMRIEDRDAAHIARCDPDTIRALCELALEGLDARREYQQIELSDHDRVIRKRHGLRAEKERMQLERDKLRAENERLREQLVSALEHDTKRALERKPE